MRALTYEEKRKRGCVYCTDYQSKKGKYGTINGCMHDECPYHELDKYEKYKDYLKHEAPKINLAILKK